MFQVRACIGGTAVWLYLRGISTGDMSEAMGIMLGGQVSGMSPNVVSRLKAQWADEHEQWNRRELLSARWVYWWADGIHTGVRSDDSDGQCLLVIIGVKPDGTKERVAIGDGYRESKASWCELLLDLKKRGLQAGPLLACGDGAMGFWSAMEEVFPQTKHQRCWFHKMGNGSTRCRNHAAGPDKEKRCRTSGWLLRVLTRWLHLTTSSIPTQPSIRR